MAENKISYKRTSIMWRGTIPKPKTPKDPKHASLKYSSPNYPNAKLINFVERSEIIKTNFTQKNSQKSNFVNWLRHDKWCPTRQS